MLVNLVAQAYGVMAIYLLIKPGDTGGCIDDWVVAVGLSVVLATGLLYLFIAKPDLRSDGVPEGDAIEIANLLRSLREQQGSR